MSLADVTRKAIDAAWEWFKHRNDPRPEVPPTPMAPEVFLLPEPPEDTEP